MLPNAMSSFSPKYRHFGFIQTNTSYLYCSSVVTLLPRDYGHEKVQVQKHKQLASVDGELKPDRDFKEHMNKCVFHFADN